MANSVLVLFGPALLLLAISSQVAYALQDNTTKLDVITTPSADTAPGNFSSGQTTQVSSNKQDSLTDGNTTVQGDSKGGPSFSTSGQNTSVVKLASVGLEPNSTKLLSLGNLSPELLLIDQAGNADPKCWLDAQDKCITETEKKLEQAKDEKTKCDIMYNDLLCEIDAICKCDYETAHWIEPKWKKDWKSNHSKCNFANYPFLSESKPYCNKTDTNTVTKATSPSTSKSASSSTTTAVDPQFNCIIDATAKCASPQNHIQSSTSSSTSTTPPDAQCRQAYERTLCFIDAGCKCFQYTVAHDEEVRLKKNLTTKNTGCDKYFKGYKYMSEDRCTAPTTVVKFLTVKRVTTVSPRMPSTTKGSTVWIIVGSSIGGVLVLGCLCICICVILGRKDDKVQPLGDNGAVGKVLSKVNSAATPMSTIPASNIGATPSKLAKASGIPSSKVDSVAKMSSVLSSKAPVANTKLAAKSKVGGPAKAAAKSRA